MTGTRDAWMIEMFVRYKRRIPGIRGGQLPTSFVHHKSERTLKAVTLLSLCASLMALVFVPVNDASIEPAEQPRHQQSVTQVHPEWPVYPTVVYVHEVIEYEKTFYLA